MRSRGAIWVALFSSAISATALAQPDKGGGDADAEADPDEGGESSDGDADGAPAGTAADGDAAGTDGTQPDAPDTRGTSTAQDRADAAAAAKSTDGAAASAPDRGFSWEPFGYLRLQYRFVQNDPNVEFIGRDDGFELQNARVGVRGALGDRAAFVLSFDGAVDEREQLNDPGGRLRVGLRDAFVDAALGSSASVRAGFFRSLADPEALVGDTARLTVDRPIESRGVRATEGYEASGVTPGRSPGFAIRIGAADVSSAARGGTGSGIGAKSTIPVGLELAVQNGADELTSNNDNDLPSVSGTLVTRIADESWLVGTARYNPRTVGDLPFRQDENDISVFGGAQIAAGPVLFKGGFVFTRTSYPTTGGPASVSSGGHGQLFFRIPGETPMAFGYRFGLLDPSSLIITDRVMEHTAAGTIGVPRYRMRLQLQVTHVVEQPSRALSNTRAQIAAEVSL